jgi:hypothetical protein
MQKEQNYFKWVSHNATRELNGLIVKMNATRSMKNYVVSLSLIFSSSFFFHCSSSRSRASTPRRTAVDPEAPCDWVIPLRSPPIPSCRKVCRKTWGPCLADCHNCTGPGASQTLPGPPGTGCCNRHPSHLRHSSFSPFAVICAETPVLVP